MMTLIWYPKCSTCQKAKKKLEELGVNATVRRRLGSEISAACGQLRREDARAGE